MKLRFATLFATGAVTAAIAAAPSAAAVSVLTSADTSPDRVVVDTRPGNAEIKVSPPEVSDARSYGQFSTPEPFLGD